MGNIKKTLGDMSSAQRMLLFIAIMAGFGWVFILWNIGVLPQILEGQTEFFSGLVFSLIALAARESFSSHAAVQEAKDIRHKFIEPEKALPGNNGDIEKREESKKILLGILEDQAKDMIINTKEFFQRWRDDSSTEKYLEFLEETENRINNYINTAINQRLDDHHVSQIIISLKRSVSAIYKRFSEFYEENAGKKFLHENRSLALVILQDIDLLEEDMQKLNHIFGDAYFEDPRINQPAIFLVPKFKSSEVELSSKLEADLEQNNDFEITADKENGFNLHKHIKYQKEGVTKFRNSRYTTHINELKAIERSLSEALSRRDQLEEYLTKTAQIAIPESKGLLKLLECTECKKENPSQSNGNEPKSKNPTKLFRLGDLFSVITSDLTKAHKKIIELGSDYRALDGFDTHVRSIQNYTEAALQRSQNFFKDFIAIHHDINDFDDPDELKTDTTNGSNISTSDIKGINDLDFTNVSDDDTGDDKEQFTEDNFTKFGIPKIFYVLVTDLRESLKKLNALAHDLKIDTPEEKKEKQSKKLKGN